ncbi:glycerophosphodiester phosphodiesterase family protein [Tropicimonas sp. IMCC34043]|uniref:glycerophosphodiester phosphodiesterase family protein n=1 Tax=Tropicimonas sp. IMCC34043 TaxID=2248760 RepID=UPI001E632948|nr:glycerophosphodiester phosphodiesterase family protein [Tropicimonas sp. IMCC34043]
MPDPVALPRAFLASPLAHRGLHDSARQRPENSRAAFAAAIAAGYGIECDLQLSADGQAMVFHDATLERLTDTTGPVQARTAGQLAAIPLRGDTEGIPDFAGVLTLVDGRVPLLVELKDQTGMLGPEGGALERAAADAVRGYPGPLAFMSFNPHSVARIADLAPEVPRGLTTCAFAPADWPGLPDDRRAELAAIADFDRVGASFVSHQASDLAAAPVVALRRAGVPILCWTIRSAQEQGSARKLADNITFEGYLPA